MSNVISDAKIVEVVIVIVYGRKRGHQYNRIASLLYHDIKCFCMTEINLF